MSLRCFLSASVLLAACAHRQPVPENDVDGIAYELRLPETVGAPVEIAVVLPADPSGATELDLPSSWAGVENLRERVGFLTVSDGSGNDLPVRRSESGWRVETAGVDMLRVRYTLQTGPRVDAQSFTAPLFQPTHTEKMLRIIGDTALLLPVHLEDEVPISLKWVGLKPGWTIWSRHGSGDVSARMRPDEFRHAMFLAGDLEVVERELKGRRVALVLEREQWPFTSEQLANLAEKTLLAERDYFNDHSDPFFLITLHASPYEGSTTGTAFGPSFSMFVSTATPLGKKYEHLLAHELMHRWISGSQLNAMDPEPSVYWFTEGFTEHLTRRVLLDTGSFTEAEALADLNETIQAYWLSPVREAPNQKIVESFFAEPPVRNLAYQRGDFLAYVLEHRLGGRSAFDRWLRDYMGTRSKDALLSPETFVAAVARATSPEFAEEVRAIIVDGRQVLPSTDALGPCFERAMRGAAKVSFGFDVERSFGKKKFVAVVPGGPAAAAGIEEGQRFETLKPVKLPTGEAFLEIVLAGGTPPVRIEPRKEMLDVPQFVPVESAACASGL